MVQWQEEVLPGAEFLCTAKGTFTQYCSVHERQTRLLRHTNAHPFAQSHGAIGNRAWSNVQ